jgi:hypothetical protein
MNIFVSMPIKYLYCSAVCLLLTTGNLSAQVVLDSTDYTSLTGTDSLKKTVVTSSFPSLSAMAGGIWDMGVVTDTSPVYFAYRVAGDVGYQFADSSVYNLSSYSFNGTTQSTITSDGVFEHAIDIPRYTYSLYSLTSGFYDSLTILQQQSIYSAARIKITFVAMPGVMWQSNYQYDLHFQLSYLVLGDTLAPGIVRSYIAEKDTIVGYGTMRVKDAYGSPSDYFNVLQVQTQIVKKDSFFLKGMPFPTPLLAALNLTQGEKDTVYEQNYYRKHELTPLAQVEFRDAGYTTPYRATTHVQRLSAAGVPEIPAGGLITVFPNPVDSRTLTVQLPSTGGLWTYQLWDAAGHEAEHGSFDQNGSITFAASLPAGVYYLDIIHDAKRVAVKALTLRAN